MKLGEVKIKNIEREDLDNMRVFAGVLNNSDKLEISMPEHIVEYILSNEEMRKSIFLAYLDEELIGFAGCMKNMSQTTSANFEIIIHPDYRHQGLGRKLYDIILARANEFKIKSATAFAKERISHSVSFVENRGFKIQKYMWKMDLELSDVEYRKIPKEQCDIRVATIEDSKDYADIMNAGFKKEGDELYTEKSFERNLKSPDTCVFFIEQDGKKVATAAVNFDKDINRGYIYNVTVYRDFRGKGFGEITLNHCINIIKDAGIAKAALNVDGTNNNALNLYKKLGFVEKDTDIMFKLEL